MNSREALGGEGEKIAAKFLTGRGYKILERNFRCKIGEIDLIASKDGFLVFIEVKTRTADSGMHPSLSVTGRKQEKVRRVGEYYQARNPGLVQQPRFDVISVEMEVDDEKVEHLTNAF